MREEKLGLKVNLFGTWIPTGDPKWDKPPPKKSRRDGSDLETIVDMVELQHVLVWPVDVEHGSRDHPHGCRIPFSTFHRLRDAHSLDFALPMWAFSDRGQLFLVEVAPKQ